MKRARTGTDDARSVFAKKAKNNDAPIEVIAKELQTEIFARVAKGSCADITTCKFSCKLFKDIAEDGYIYRHVSLDKIPISSWFPDENRESFLERCEQYRNPETMYRQAVVDYFSRGSSESAFQYLQNAMELGHEEAPYLSCILLMFNSNEEMKEKGIKLLARLKKSNRRKVREFRRKLMNHLRMIWVLNQSLMPKSICCKTNEENHKKKRNWNLDEYEDSLECEACLAEFELRCIFGELGSGYLF